MNFKKYKNKIPQPSNNINNISIKNFGRDLTNLFNNNNKNVYIKKTPKDMKNIYNSKSLRNSFNKKNINHFYSKENLYKNYINNKINNTLIPNETSQFNISNFNEKILINKFSLNESKILKQNDNNNINIDKINIINKHKRINSYNKNNITYQPNHNKSKSFSHIENKNNNKNIIKNNTINLYYQKNIIDNNKFYLLLSKNITPQIPIEYLNDIYLNLLNEIYHEFPINNYLNNTQSEINITMRSILIDWLIDVHLKFNFFPNTLFITVNIIDKFLSIKNCSKKFLQLIGISALMISCKFNEIEIPKIEDFIYITDNAYTINQVKKMEYEILKILKFKICFPTMLNFFEILSENFNFDKIKFLMGNFLMENFLIDFKSIKYNGSIIACAITYIIMKFYKEKNYKESYDKKYFIGKEKDIKDCAKDICLWIDNINKTEYKSVQKKYMKNEFGRITYIIQGK